MTVIKEYQETPEVRPRTMQEVQCEACPAMFTRSGPYDYRCSYCDRDFCVKHPRIEGELRIHVNTPSDNFPNMTTQVILGVMYCCLDCFPTAINRNKIDRLVVETGAGNKR